MPVMSRGSSSTAKFIEDNCRPLSALGNTATFGRDPAFQELAVVYEETKTPNWDGHGALPVEQDVLRAAYCVIEALPLGFHLPSIGAEPDGAITLEWHKSIRRTLSVSVDANSTLHYAALAGAEKAFGSVPFDGDLPATIKRLVIEVLS